ncbi:hypothetical protein RI367_005248 [Sorochytrium milnesiophthora]
MPLYEIITIARLVGEAPRVFAQEPISALLRATAGLIYNRGGVVRSLENMGERDLPYRMKAHQEYQERGHYFAVRFDAAPELLPVLSRQMQLDNRVIRHTIIKVGDKLEDISGLPEQYVRKRRTAALKKEKEDAASSTGNSELVAAAQQAFAKAKQQVETPASNAQ